MNGSIRQPLGMNAALEWILTDLTRPENDDSELAVTGLFVFIGAKPGTGWLAGQLAEDRHGFLLTGSDIPASRRENENLTPLFLETSRQKRLLRVGPASVVPRVRGRRGVIASVANQSSGVGTA